MNGLLPKNQNNMKENKKKNHKQQWNQMSMDNLKILENSDCLTTFCLTVHQSKINQNIYILNQ